MAIRRRVSEADGAAALATVRGVFEAGTPLTGGQNREEMERLFASLPRGVRATAVRYSLEELGTLAPGNSVEVRVPPFGVTQCVAGPRHTRGTPPSVVEARPLVWAALVLGACSWAQAVGAGALDASGERSDLSGLLPLF